MSCDHQQVVSLNTLAGRKGDVRVSSSQDQIVEIKNKFIEENIKKGWELV